VLWSAGAERASPLVFNLIEKIQDAGIDVLTIDMSDRKESDRSALREAADKTSMLYMRLENREDARLLLDDLVPVFRGMVARDAKARVVFDPARVERYRLIASEKRTSVDRLLWRKDKGEVYDGHILTAWYEVKLTTVGGELGRAEVEYATPDRRPVEWSAAMPEDRLAPGFLQARDDFQLAAVVNHVGEGLSDARWEEDAPLAAALEEANALPPEIRRLPAVMEWANRLQAAIEESRRPK
jgi:hypothetical protein